MRVKFWAAAAALAFGATALQAMDADTFYTKSIALQKKGMAAMFSSDLKPVMSEIQGAIKSVKAENDTAKAAGKPIYCPPATRAKMSSDQLLAEFGKIPAAQRKAMTVKAAWRSIMVRKYPC